MEIEFVVIKPMEECLKILEKNKDKRAFIHSYNEIQNLCQFGKKGMLYDMSSEQFNHYGIDVYYLNEDMELERDCMFICREFFYVVK